MLATAQLATFEALPLPGTDTYYVNKNQMLQDVGFDNANIHFPYVWDTAYGGSWGAGFSYSNKKDSVTSGYTNQYSAKTANGYNGSDKYVVYWQGYGPAKAIALSDKKAFAPQGFYYTNTTYAYNSMRDGDFAAKKFGGVSGNDSDWFRVSVWGYRNGILKPDSITFYLADFRFANNAQDYIVKDWRYVSLTTLGTVDSLYFKLSSTDNHPVYGMNTPAYFAMDNFSVIPVTGVGAVNATTIAKVYPNPATNCLIVSVNDAAIAKASVYDLSGKLIASHEVMRNRTVFNTANFSSGIYLLKLEGAAITSTTRFVKQ